VQLSFLEPLFDRRGPWATVHLDPAQNDESGAKRRELMVREACRTLEEEGADAATIRAVGDALTNITPGEDPAGRVIFAAGGEVVLSHRLARRPQRQLACWAPLPRLTQLLELCSQDPVCLVAIDRTGADFELRAVGGPQDAGHVEGRQRPVHRTASADWSERHFQLKVENTWEHNAGAIAEALRAERPDLRTRRRRAAPGGRRHRGRRTDRSAVGRGRLRRSGRRPRRTAALDVRADPGVTTEHAPEHAPERGAPATWQPDRPG
jgi:hypothetical protein